MNKNMQPYSKVLAVLSAAAAFCVTTQASIVYNNSTTYLGLDYKSTNEFGDQIKLDAASTDRIVTEVNFEYYLSHDASGNEKADLRIYNNAIPNSIDPSAVGTLVYDSGMYSIASGYNQFDVTGLNLLVTSDLTWTVQFSGIETGESAGLLFYNPPTTGSSLDDFWEKENGVWTLKRLSTDGGPIANFGVQITAIPEPTTIQLALMSGMAWLGMATYRRRK
jgi:hypothetical protein